MNEQRDLEGLTALVTGATSGIGKAVAEELGRHGADQVFRWAKYLQLVDLEKTKKAKYDRPCYSHSQ
jgi:NAD(P)-dependent dehydrogenase (short-subunit alcohol dehydrogenase family)